MSPQPARKTETAKPRRRLRATYVYAVAASATPPDLDAAPSGVPGAGRPRCLELLKGRWLVVADVPAAEYASEALERGLADLTWVSDRAVAHEAMIEHLARRATVVPTKLFTLFTSDARAQHHLAGQEAELGSILERIEGCQEWGVRVVRAARRSATPRPRTGALGGREYLERRKAERDQEGVEAAAAQDQIERLFGSLDRSSRDVRRRPPLRLETGESLLLDAAFLVERRAAVPFERAVRRGAAALQRAGCELTLSGPWPAYNFVADEEAAK